MHKISLYGIGTFLILTGVGGWIASNTQARQRSSTWRFSSTSARLEGASGGNLVYAGYPYDPFASTQ